MNIYANFAHTIMIIIFGLVVPTWYAQSDPETWKNGIAQSRIKKKFLHICWSRLTTIFFLLGFCFVCLVYRCPLCIVCVSSFHLTTFPIIIEVVCVSFIENLFKTNSSVSRWYLFRCFAMPKINCRYLPNDTHATHIQRIECHSIRLYLIGCL